MLNDILLRVGNVDSIPVWSRLESNRVYDLSVEDVAYLIKQGASDWPSGYEIVASTVDASWDNIVSLCNENGFLAQPEPVEEQVNDPVEDTVVSESDPVEDQVEYVEPTLLAEQDEVELVALTLDDVPHLSQALIEQMNAEGITLPYQLLSLTLDQLTAYSGIGNKTGQAILDWLEEQYG